MRIFGIATVAAMATSAVAQEARVESVEDGVAVRMSRTMQVEPAIAQTVWPYVNCLSERSGELQAEDRFLSDSPAIAEEIKAHCSDERDLAIYHSAVALERAGQVAELDRPALILRSIEALENLTLVPPELPEEFRQSQ